MPWLETSGLTAFYGDFQARFGIDIHLDEAETVAIIGANGAGKTTLLRSISGVLKNAPDSVTFDDAAIGHLDADKVTALTAAQAICAALFARERSGQGQHVRLSMLDAMIAFFWPEGMGGLVYVGEEVDVTQYQGTMDLIYKTRNGYMTAAAISDKEWRGLCVALGKEEWIEEPRFATTAARFRNAGERKALTAEQLLRWDRDEILARLDAEGVPSAPLLTRPELLNHEQIIANDTLGIYDFDGHGQVRLARPAARFEDTPADVEAPAPVLGEHSEAVLRELGYSESAVGALLDSGALIASAG